ncbi:hypothetical protein [Bacillus sp. FJAT-49736]|nr:hypothetical protein [Bacillus sp. FJAT-49736]MBS4174226.1 hypothetical protein [Bacillus sp. FJAT-49736]
MKDVKNEEKTIKDLFGVEPDMSLQSVQFAASENRYLTEHEEEDLE